MIKTLALIIGIVFVVSGCGGYAPTGYGSAEEVATVEAVDPVMEKAAEDLKAVKAVKSEWRFIDKAGGGSAQDMSKFMEIAQKKAAEGDIEEAHRIAGLISKYAALGIAQAEKQKNAKPYYP